MADLQGGWRLSLACRQNVMPEQSMLIAGSVGWTPLETAVTLYVSGANPPSPDEG